MKLQVRLPALAPGRSRSSLCTGCERGPLPRGVGLAAWGLQLKVLGAEGDILARGRHQFGLAQRAGIAEHLQGAITQVGQAADPSGGIQLLDLGRERCGADARPGKL